MDFLYFRNDLPGQATSQPDLKRPKREPEIVLQSTASAQAFAERYLAERYLDEIDLLRRMNRVEAALENLKGFFSVSTVGLNTLGSHELQLKTPLNIAIEQRKVDEFVACLYDANLYGYGDTIPEALDDLKAAIVNQFEYLTDKETEVELGKDLKRQLDFLRDNIVKNND